MSAVLAPTGAGPTGALARVNPSVKLVLLLVVSATVSFVLDPVTPAVLYVLALTVVMAGTRMPPRRLLLAHLPFAGFAVGVFTVNALSRPGPVALMIGPLWITEDGLTIGAALALRTLLVGVLAIGFLASTDAVRLMHSLHQNLHVGARPTFAILAGYRMLAQMPKEWATIRAAQAIRSPGGARLGLRGTGRALFALLVTTVRKGERVAQALESRGLGAGERTIWHPERVRGSDRVLAVAVLGVLALVLGVSARCGVLRGPGAMFGG
jgi:energy-coupling factor transport system permease protein